MPAILTRRELLLAILLVIVLVWMGLLSLGGYTTAPYDLNYLASSLVDAVPLAILALAELLVIVSGRGGIDLSIGAIASLAGMVFGFAYGPWQWPLVPAVLLAAVAGALLGAVNGVLVSGLGFPALIATLATYYSYQSLAIVINDQKPISTVSIQGLYSLADSVTLPVIGQWLPALPLGVFTFLLPAGVLTWLLLQRSTYGRQLFAIGTNDVAAHWSGLPVARTRVLAYALSGLLAGLAAVYLTGQFASARPDVGTSGNGLALPAITIAVLGGVAITGGIGRVSGVLLATVLITWLNAGLLLLFEGNAGAQFQLMALGTVLIASALLNEFARRRYSGTR